MRIVHSHLPGIVIREIFRIVGPALGVAAVVEKIPESRCFHFPKILSAVNSLVEMPGIAFMGQGGIERQVIMEIASVHTDRLRAPVINRGDQIVGRAGVFLHGGRDSFQYDRYRREWIGSTGDRKILLDPFVKLL